MIATIIGALAPIALLIGFGLALRQRQALADSFWPQAERLGYYVLLPALFLYSLATSHMEGLPVGAMVAAIVLSTLAVAAALVLLKPAMAIDGPGFTSVFQGGVRFNNYIGVTAAAGIFGAQGVALSAVANASIVPTVNVLCVLVFASFGAAKLSFTGVLKQIALNPLVLACAGGIALNLLGLGLPPGIEPALRALGQASLPLGLLCVGAALNLGAIRSWAKPIAIASVAKLVVMPAVTALACLAFGLKGPAAATALIFQALPTASSSYIMARQLGGDAPLMAGITAVQTVIAALTMPIALTLLLGWVAG